MRVLAIDPGFGRCGVAVVEKESGKEVVVHSACIETSAGSEFSERLAHVVGECERLIKEFRPDAVALEKVYFAKNQKTALQVAEVRGALIQTATASGLRVSEYAPAQIKSAVAGWGGADKRAVASMLKALVRIQKDIKYDDEYDAIAIGVTHLAHTR